MNRTKYMASSFFISISLLLFISVFTVLSMHSVNALETAPDALYRGTQTVVSADIPDAVLKRAALLKVRALIETSKWNPALVLIGKLSERYPHDRYIKSDTARIHRNLGHNQKALKIYKDLLNDYPSEKDYITEIAYILSDLKRYHEAESFLQKHLDKKGMKDDSILMLLASIETNKGNYEQATEYLESIVKSSPKNVRALLDLGSLYVQKGKTAEGIKLYERAEAFSPETPDILKSLAYAWSGIDPYKQRKYLFRLLKIDPNDSDVYYLLAENYYSVAPSKARNYYRKALKLLVASNSGAINSKKMKARCYIRLNQSEKGLAIYKNLIKTTPDDYDLINDYAEALIELKLYTEAMEALKPLESRF